MNTIFSMTRGNQREIDRARAEARHAGKGTAKEGDHLARKVSLIGGYCIIRN